MLLEILGNLRLIAVRLVVAVQDVVVLLDVLLLVVVLSNSVVVLGIVLDLLLAEMVVQEVLVVLAIVLAVLGLAEPTLQNLGFLGARTSMVSAYRDPKGFICFVRLHLRVHGMVQRFASEDSALCWTKISQSLCHHHQSKYSPDSPNMEENALPNPPKHVCWRWFHLFW